MLEARYLEGLTYEGLLPRLWRNRDRVEAFYAGLPPLPPLPKAQRALALAEEFGLRAVPLEKAREARLLVNATRVGLEDPSASPLPAELFPEEGAAVDLVYRPLWTRFLREAKAKGLKVQTGLPMLAWQGALAFRLWTGLLPDPSGMEEAARRALGV